MIRYLLGSTVIVSTLIVSAQTNAATTGPTPAMATPQLKISGQTSFNSWFYNNKQLYIPGDPNNKPCGRKNYSRGQLFTVDGSRLKFNVDGRTDRGMEYGLVIVLDGNTDKDKIVREDYLYFGGSWGKIYAGDTYGAQDFMSFGGFDQWGGTGFIDGSFDRAVNFTTGTLHSVDLVGDTGRETKFTYTSPRWKGIQVGASYTPRTEHRGEAKGNNSRTSVSSPKEPFSTDNIASGINFLHEFSNGFKMALSGTSIFGKGRAEFQGAPKRRNVASYAFGGTFEYQNVGFSAEYGNNGRSYQLKSLGNKVNAGQFIDFGLSYKWGATKFGTGLYYAWKKTVNEALTAKKTAKTRGVQAAVDRKLAPGLGVYFEYMYLQMKNPDAIADANRTNAILHPNCGQFVGPVKSNRSNVFVVGSRLVF